MFYSGLVSNGWRKKLTSSSAVQQLCVNRKWIASQAVKRKATQQLQLSSTPHGQAPNYWQSVPFVSGLAAACPAILFNAYHTSERVICEPQVPDLKLRTNAIQVTHATASAAESSLASLLNSIKNTFQSIGSDVIKLARYTRRLLLYALFGMPLLGLAPTAYLLGDAFPALEDLTWDYILWAVEGLGPCFIKLSQWASTRPDLFPPRLVQRLSRLQCDVTVRYPSSVVEQTLTESFGEQWREVLEIDLLHPIGAGSVAQVFRGKMRDDSRDVAVKMIHPHVEELVKVDMELLSVFAYFMDQFPSLEILGLGETCRQFGESMRLQLDLRIEARNLLQFASKFTADKWAVFPEPVQGLVSKHVLVETLLEGAPISSYMNAHCEVGEALYKLKMKISDLGCRLILKMVFFDNFIHGDLHPGNLMVQILPNGDPRLVVLDCGIVYFTRNETEYRRLIDICYAFMKHDGRAAGRHMVANCTANTVMHAEAFCEGIQDMVNSSEQQSYFEHIGDYVSTICELSRRHVVRLDPSYFKIAMALKVAEGISLALNKDLDLVTKCLPILVKAQALKAMGRNIFPPPDEDPDREIDSKTRK